MMKSKNKRRVLKAALGSARQETETLRQVARNAALERNDLLQQLSKIAQLCGKPGCSTLQGGTITLVRQTEYVVEAVRHVVADVNTKIRRMVALAEQVEAQRDARNGVSPACPPTPEQIDHIVELEAANTKLREENLRLAAIHEWAAAFGVGAEKISKLANETVEGRKAVQALADLYSPDSADRRVLENALNAVVDTMGQLQRWGAINDGSEMSPRLRKEFSTAFEDLRTIKSPLCALFERYLQGVKPTSYITSLPPSQGRLDGWMTARACGKHGCPNLATVEGYKGSLRVFACDAHAHALEDALGNSRD